MDEDSVERARDSLFIGMPIAEQAAVESPEPVTAAVDILSDERTDQLLNNEDRLPAVTTSQINDHNADDEGGEEPEIL